MYRWSVICKFLRQIFYSKWRIQQKAKPAHAPIHDKARGENPSYILQGDIEWGADALNVHHISGYAAVLLLFGIMKFYVLDLLV